MKRFMKPSFLIVVSVILVLPLCLVSCGSKKTSTTSTVKTTVSTSKSTTNITTASNTLTTASTPAASSVPAEYQALYTELSSEMGHFEGVLNQKSVSSQQPVFATDLLFANGNVGPGLLTTTTMNNNIVLLNRLQSMGFKGVVIAIKFPLLKPDFPHSADYLKFYQQILAECHKRGLKVLVECGAIFSGTPYSPVQIDWSQYTTQTFLQGLEDQLLLVAKEIKPDYLTLANEPQTDESLTGLSISPAVWRNFIADTVAKVDRSSGVLVGAGTGTWENPAYINELFNMAGLDYIDLHVYPMNKDAALLDRALTYAQQARAAGKRVTISESWLWKASPDELGNGLGDTDTIMNRDMFSFWEPLDERFLQDMMKLADVTGMDFVSFFWMRNFFAYLDYNTTAHNLTTEELTALMNQNYVSNVLQGNLSPPGLYIQEQLNAQNNK
jgi:hypothetical protein